jgi:hypothetical protein
MAFLAQVIEACVLDCSFEGLEVLPEYAHEHACALI